MHQLSSAPAPRLTAERRAMSASEEQHHPKGDRVYEAEGHSRALARAADAYRSKKCQWRRKVRAKGSCHRASGHGHATRSRGRQPQRRGRTEQALPNRRPLRWPGRWQQVQGATRGRTKAHRWQRQGCSRRRRRRVAQDRVYRRPQNAEARDARWRGHYRDGDRQTRAEPQRTPVQESRKRLGLKPQREQLMWA